MPSAPQWPAAPGAFDVMLSLPLGQTREDARQTGDKSMPAGLCEHAPKLALTPDLSGHPLADGGKTGAPVSDEVVESSAEAGRSLWQRKAAIVKG